MGSTLVSNNPFAMAVLTAKMVLANYNKGDKQLFDQAYNLAKRLLTKQMPKEKVRKLMSFLRFYVNFENQEIITKFEQEIAILTERKVTMGIEEFLLDRAEKKGIEKGIQKGKEENMRETAIKMKENNYDLHSIAIITGLSEDDIKKIS
jgi:predicted transposase/invertase (TIGR01784 family)